MLTNGIQILDTTLRDGSYITGYQFDKKDTAIISKCLELAGIKYIELGHGMGLNASKKGFGYQACSDIEYMKICQKILKNSFFGFFHIADIGGRNDIERLSCEGGRFIRFGINNLNFSKSLKNIEFAKFTNFTVQIWDSMHFQAHS